MTYPLMSNLSGVTGVIEYANNVSGGWYMSLIVLAIAIIILVALMRLGYRKSDCVTVSGALTFILSALLFAAKLVNGKIVMIALVYLVIGIAYSFIE